MKSVMLGNTREALNPYTHSPTPHRLPDRLSILYLATRLPQGWSLSPDTACSLRGQSFLHPKENSLPWTSSVLQDCTEKNSPLIETWSRITLLLSSLALPKALQPLILQHDPYLFQAQAKTAVFAWSHSQ